jgi:hypothetical protein
MKTLFPDVPPDEALVAGLTTVLGARVEILDREPNVYRSSFPSEVVTCRVGEGPEVRLLCKFGAQQGATAFGHRGGTAYEAWVYRHLLQPLRVGAPQFLGAYTAPGRTDVWIVLEYLDGAERLELTGDPDALTRATTWAGAFHRQAEARPDLTRRVGIPHYDASYYRAWSARAMGRIPRDRAPWLPAVCARFDSLVGSLAAWPKTLVHGEFTVHNVLLRAGRIRPVDWESAAVAVGEIDLAGVTEGWSAEVVDKAVTAYRRARWPGGTPTGFGRVLDLARMYWSFRWLGDADCEETEAEIDWRLGQTRNAVSKLGFAEAEPT